MKSEGKSPAIQRGFFVASAAWCSARLRHSRHLGGSLDAALFFDGLVGGGDAVEAGTGLFLVFGAHVAHLVGVELDGHTAEGPWFLLDVYKLGAIHR